MTSMTTSDSTTYAVNSTSVFRLNKEMRIMAGKIRKLFTNDEVLAAVAGTDSLREAAVRLENLRGVAVGPQLLRYWMQHLSITRLDGTPYANTSVLDREISQKLELRKPSPDDYDRREGSKDEIDNSVILNIPDQHAPYHHQDAVSFLCDIAARIRPTRVVNLGDETDGHALSMHDSDPSLDSAGPELYKARMFINDLASVFPVMDVCHSNHGSLIYRRAFKAGIPAEYIKTYREILFPDGGGDGWEWKERINVALPTGDNLIYQHQSSGPTIANAAHEGAHIIEGHQHGQFEIQYRESVNKRYWALISGCLIDADAYAFGYGKLFPKKPVIGCSAVIDGEPLLFPMPMDRKGRYTGKLSKAVPNLGAYG